MRQNQTSYDTALVDEEELDDDPPIEQLRVDPADAVMRFGSVFITAVALLIAGIYVWYTGYWIPAFLIASSAFVASLLGITVLSWPKKVWRFLFLFFGLIILIVTIILTLQARMA